MNTFPTNHDGDWTRTQAAPWRTPSPDAPTMAAYFGPTAPPQAYPQQPLAWSAEQPEFNSFSPSYPAQQPWYARPRVAGLAAAGLVAAAAAGFFGALHGSSSSTPMNTAAHSAPAPAPAPMPTAQPSAPSFRPTPHRAMPGDGYSKPARHQAPPQSPPPAAPPQQQTDQSNDGSQWDNSGDYWWTHRGDHDSRWRSDHDNRWNFWRHHDSDSNSSVHHDNSSSSNDQSGDSK